MAALPTRSNAEAHLYMELHPCERCGGIELAQGSSVILVDGELATRHAGDCTRCGAAREFVFRLPEQEPFPDEEEPSFGDDQPSEIIDAGEWLWLADLIAQATPAGTGDLTEEDRHQARFDLRTAAAAVAEAIKFVPPDAEAVPAESLWSSRGRAVYQDEPGRFRLPRLQAARRSLRDLADSIVA
jgi:hypothetical protein